MTARPEFASLEPLLEQLGLRQAAVVLPDWLDRAASQELSYADFLHGLLEEESVARSNAATQKRLRQASFPYAATIEQFDFRYRPELKRQVVLRYLDPTFIEQARTLALIGPPGLGKTMLAICIATKHIQIGTTARFITAQHLANQLGRALTSAGRQRVLRPLLACDVLVLDELGYLPTLPGFGPALYELIAGRYERRPTLITSNKSLTEWAAIVQDASLAAALVDRILHHGEVFYLKGPSWRLKGRSPEGEPVAAASSATSNGTDSGPDAQHRIGGTRGVRSALSTSSMTIAPSAATRDEQIVFEHAEPARPDLLADTVDEDHP